MYDFTTVVDRKGQGSSKWEGMYALNADVPEGIVPFSVADMELLCPPEVTEGLKAYLDGLVLGYTSATEGYTRAVRDWMQRRHNFAVQPEWILQSSGVVPAFYTAVQTFTRPGDGVIVMTPVYYPFYSAMERQGRSIVRNPLRIENGRYEIDFDDLEQKARDPKNSLLLFCSPHNPVGRVWTRPELEKIAKICLENDVLIVSDEIHFDLEMPGYTHTVLQTLSGDIADHCITCTAPSKTFNLAGMQASNIIIKNEKLRNRFADTQLQSAFFGLNILAYKSCEIAYTQCEKWLDELIALIAANEKTARDFFAARIPQIVPFKMEGTYLQWWDCRALGLSHEELEQFMIHDALLFLDEGYIFGDEGRGFERINLACPTALLTQALERLEAALKKKGLL